MHNKTKAPPVQFRPYITYGLMDHHHRIKIMQMPNKAKAPFVQSYELIDH